MVAEAGCAICGEAGHPRNPLIVDDYDPRIRAHLGCLNSPEGRAWDDSRRAADPGYARYSALITVGRPVECASCGAPDRVSPKGFGMGAGHWEANCTRCHRCSPGLNAYRSPAEAHLLKRIRTLWQSYKRSDDVRPALLEEIGRLERHADPVGPGPAPCVCGGTYSLLSPPRCARCRRVLLDSPFHIALGPAR